MSSNNDCFDAGQYHGDDDLRVAVPVNSRSVDQVLLPPLAYAQVEAPLPVVVVVVATVVIVVVVVVLKAST